MVIKTKIEFQEFLFCAKENNVLLMPEINFETDFVSLQISELPICTYFNNPELFNDDLWSGDGLNFFFTKRLLDKIAITGGVQFTDSALCLREVGEDRRVVYLKHKIRYEYRASSAEIVSSVVTGEYSYQEDLRTIVYKNDVFANSLLLHLKGEPVVNLIERRRSSSGSVAEANAKRKALTEVFPRLKKPFSLDELKQPLFVGKIVFDKESILKINPEFKKAYIAKMLDLGACMYSSVTENNPKF